MKCTQYVGVCLQSLTVLMTYTSSHSVPHLTTDMRRSVPSLHSWARCLFTVVQDSDSSRSGASCTDNQMGRQASEWASFWAHGEAYVSVWVSVWACDEVHSVSWLQCVSCGWLCPLVTNHPLFTSLTLTFGSYQRCWFFSAFCFLCFQCFLHGDRGSFTWVLLGEQRKQGKVYERSRAQCACY